MLDLTKPITVGTTAKTLEIKIEPYTTMVSRGDGSGGRKLIPFLVTHLVLQAGTYPSREAGRLGQEVKNVQLVAWGKPVENHKLKGKSLVADELAVLKEANAEAFQFGNEQIAFTANAEFEKGTSRQRKGEATIQFRWDDESIPKNSIQEGGKTVSKIENEVLNPLRDFSQKIVNAILADVAWTPVLEEFVAVRDRTPKKDETENESVAEKLAQAGVGGAAPSEAGGGL